MADKSGKIELNALISLLDEPSDKMYDQIREKIFYYGTEAIPLLEDAWDNSFNNTIQNRIEEIIHSIQFDNLVSELQKWKKGNHFDLLKGFFLISKYQYPDLTEKTIADKLEKIRKDIWLELNNELTALEKIKVINHILFDIHRFSGSKPNLDMPQNYFLNNLLDTKKGNHLSLGILFIILAQKTGLPVFGVDLPQHFILAYADEVHEELLTSTNENEVLFYINPFNKGAVFTQREIELFVKHLKLKPNSKYFKPCDNISIIKRLLKNLSKAYNKMGYVDKVNELNSLLDILTK